MSELIIEGKVKEVVRDYGFTGYYTVGTYIWMGIVRKMIEFLRDNVSHEIIIRKKRGKNEELKRKNKDL